MAAIQFIKKLRGIIVGQYHALLQIKDTPHAIAMGVGIGIFYGFLPVFIPFVPVKTALSFLTAWLFRCSKTAALISVTAYDVIFPILPLVLRWEYQVGYYLIHRDFPPKLEEARHHLRFERWFSMETYDGWWNWIQERMHWAFFAKILGPMTLGAIVIGLPVALVAYVVALGIVRRYQAANAKETKAK